MRWTAVAQGVRWGGGKPSRGGGRGCGVMLLLQTSRCQLEATCSFHMATQLHERTFPAYLCARSARWTWRRRRSAPPCWQPSRWGLLGGWEVMR